MTISLNSIFLFITIGLTIWLGVVLLRWKHYREYKFFSAYIAYAIIISVVQFLVRNHQTAYFYAYWLGEAGYKVLAILALLEAFRNVFRAFFVYRWFWLVFPGVVTVVLLLATWYGVQNPPREAAPIIKVILGFEVGVDLVEVGILAVFFALALFFEVHWRSYPLAIVEGFAAVGLAALAFALRSQQGSKLNPLVENVSPITYIVALILWLTSFRRPPDAEPPWTSQINPEQMLEEVRKYLSILRRLQGKHK